MGHGGQQVYTTLSGLVTGATQRPAVDRDRLGTGCVAGQPGADRVIQSIAVNPISAPAAAWFRPRWRRLLGVRIEKSEMKEQQGILWVSHNQYWIADGLGIDSLPLATYRSDNGLVEIVTENLAVIFTGTEAGPVDLCVRWHDDVPERDGDDGEWDEIVEFSIEFEDDELGGISSLGDDAGRFSSVPELAGAGWYRFRLHARGRDFAHEVITVTGTPREAHLLQVWPAPHADVAILKLTDKLGERRRAR